MTSTEQQRKRRYTAEDVALWKTYLDEGMPYRQVAEVVGVYRETISRHLPGMGMPIEEARKLGTFMKHHNHRMRRQGRGLRAGA
jgi:hypothetical protein